MNNENMLVSICMITYNHERYIAQAIEGVLIQNTNFPIQLIIGEDCSTDNTRKICLEYKQKYPDKIRLLLPEKNLGMMPNFIVTLQACTAKYIALCEGDDYWTDPLKLQKQVDFLEANENYSMCFHNAQFHYEDNSREDFLMNKIEEPREFTGIEIYEKWIVPTASVVIRKSVVESSIYKKALTNKDFIYGDIVLFLSAATNGKMWGMMSSVMSIYRKSVSGVSYGRNGNMNQYIKGIAHAKNIWRVFGRKYKPICNRQISLFNYSLVLYAFEKHKYMSSLIYLCKSFFISPKTFINGLISKF